MKNDPFEHIRHMQEMMDKMDLKSIQKQLDMVQSSKIFEKIELVKDLTPHSIKFILDNKPLTISKYLEILKQEKDIISAVILTTSESMLQLQEIVKKVSHSRTSPIPDSIYPSLNELSSTVFDVIPEKEHADLSTPIIKVPSDSQECSELWTWEKLKWFIEKIIIPLIITWHFSNVASEQLDRHHQENLQQRESHHQELLIEEQKQTRLSEERIEREKRLTDALNNLTKAIDPYISQSPDDTEVDQSDSTSK
ncbi:hypothetical protein C4A76_14925 [Brevibacillus laterosporus]|uniref:hypothetical protein n=1 Tax=Brevibacillus laterosporus TaxID=1465 RepID=UPI000CE3F57C|nr:hypothetical protein [Brevibacillus laterosporus]PPA85934.1 hypothetical protein C4A76_14925 [Brevibacillus laterosporus]